MSIPPVFDLAAAIAADARPGQFFVLDRAGAAVRVHEADLTAAERVVLGLPPLPPPPPAPELPPPRSAGPPAPEET